MYSMVCDRCGKPLIYDDSIVAWNDECSAREVAQDSEWQEIDGKDYCPNCYEFNDELDEYIPKEGGNDENTTGKENI